MNWMKHIVTLCNKSIGNKQQGKKNQGLLFMYSFLIWYKTKSRDFKISSTISFRPRGPRHHDAAAPFICPFLMLVQKKRTKTCLPTGREKPYGNLFIFPNTVKYLHHKMALE